MPQGSHQPSKRARRDPPTSTSRIFSMAIAYFSNFVARQLSLSYRWRSLCSAE
ncbi:MAG: hypothetical protein KME05_23945 [Gloeocapsa sp. UFS-A4-WI-NPMV-4B04]|nr:hypothetical protein [Gloeocapsa sp. UFS-A4-WI-NPMV-4B04]